MARATSILLIGDSLGLPRSTPEIVEAEHTWPQLLQKELKNCTVETLFLGGAKISDLQRQLEYYRHFKPDIAVFQCGIVDCAPRALTLKERELFDRFWLLRRVLLPVILRNTNWLRKVRRKRYTQPHIFRKFIQMIKDDLGNSNIVWVEIMPASTAYEKRIPGIAKSIAEYNKIINEEIANVIPSGDFGPDMLMSDDHHLNINGNQLLSQRILEYVNNSDEEINS